MRFAHFADCHLGGWREPKLRKLNLEAFKKAIELCKERQVEIVLIAGDLFNTSLPPIDILKEVVVNLKQLRDIGARIYAVAGSHDFSPSGKTMLDVLENAGLLVNVSKGSVENGLLKLEFTQDKSGVKLTGLPGRKAMLEGSYYEALDVKHIEKEGGEKIFLFHTAISEYKPKEFEQMDSMGLSMLPKGFDYYAGGHVHAPLVVNAKGLGWLVMPGPLFPNNFSELERLGHGSMVFFDGERPELVDIQTANVVRCALDCEGKTPEQVTRNLLEFINAEVIKDSLVLLRLEGRLITGKVSEIDFNGVFKKAIEKGAYFVMKNTNKLNSKDFEGARFVISPSEDVEAKVVKEHQSKMGIFNNEQQIVRDLISALSKEKGEGETKTTYEERILREFLEYTKSI